MPNAKHSGKPWTTLRPGDTLVVPSLDRLGRSLADLPSNPERPTDSARRDHLFQTTTY